MSRSNGSDHTARPPLTLVADDEPEEETRPGTPQRVTVKAMIEAVYELRDVVVDLGDSVRLQAGNLAALNGVVHRTNGIIRAIAIGAGVLAIAGLFLWWLR